MLSRVGLHLSHRFTTRQVISRVFALVLALHMPKLVLATGAAHKRNTCPHPIDHCMREIVHKFRSTGFIGVEIKHLERGGVLITNVLAGTPAEKAGIHPGDKLLALNGFPFRKNSPQVARVLKPGNEVTCTVKRNGTNQDLKLTLGPMPASMLATYIGEHMMTHVETSTKANLANTLKVSKKSPIKKFRSAP